RANIRIITPSTTIPSPAEALYPLDGGTQVPVTSNLSWNPGTIWPAGYRLSLGTNNPPTNIIDNQDLGNVTSYNPAADFQSSTTYYWKIVPYNTFGDADNCPVWSFTTVGDGTVTTLPYYQHFDAVTAPTLPFDWTAIVQSSSTSAIVATYASTTYAHSQPNCVRLYNPSDASATLILVGPTIAGDLETNGIRVRFWARSSGANYPVSIGVIGNPTDASTYVEVQNLALTTTLTEYTVALTGYTGDGVNIAIKHGLGGTGRSIYVDDITFEQIAANDLACTALTGNTTPSVGNETTYNAAIFNWGTATQTTYTVKLFDAANVELATAVGVTIAPNATENVALNWTPTTQGPMELHAQVFLAGDVNPTNDSSPGLTVAVQAPGSVMVTVGDGSQEEGIPLDFYYRNSLHEAIYYQTELNTFGNITALTFYNNFVTNLPNMPVKIWLGQTTLENLSAGWILPSAGLTLVYDGNVNFPSGLNSITIPLQVPFTYTSGNLVLYANRPYDADYYNTNDNFKGQTIGTNRGRKLTSDSTTYDPMAPSAAGTLSGKFAKTSFTFVTSGFAELEGVVTSGGNPVADVNISIDTTALTDVTDAAGAYGFPFVQPGQYNVTASKLGYETQTLPVTLVADQTTTLNFNMVASSSVNVSGQVVGSDQPTVGLVDAEVTLVGQLTYTALTNATGNFTIPGVLSGNTYSYSIQKEGYQELSGNVTIGTTDYNMGILTLNEIAFPPSNVVATENVAQTQVSLIWNTPVPEPPMDDFEDDNGGWVPTSNWTDPLGDWQWTDSYTLDGYVDIDTYVDAPPATAHSGTGLWGTKVAGGYSNCAGWSYLRKTYDLSGVNNPVLSFWHYMDGYNTWDYGLIKVNGNTVWGDAAAAEFMPWQELTISLSAYQGMSNVELSFEWYATSVVSYAGWYIDDLYVGSAQTLARTYIPTIIPHSFREPKYEATALETGKQRTSDFSTMPQEPQNERILTGYKVWRLLAANEDNESLWTLLTPTAVTDTTYIDTAWQPLPSGVYEFAVKTVYSNNVLSEAAFSNEIHKGMMGTLTGTVSEFGTNVPVAGATVTAGDYSGISNAQGVYAFLAYQGTYNVTCEKPGYQTGNQAGVVVTGTQTTTLNFVLTELTLPPGGVTAAVVVNDVNLTWTEPGTATATWLHYDSGENDDSIGTGAAADFDVAIRFPGTALQDYIGTSLYALKLWPSQAGTFSARVWTGGTSAAPATMVVDQAFTPTLDVYNTVVLNNPVPVTGNEELWFGYRCNVTTGYPAGCDAGPAIDGFGNMMYYQGAWTTLLDLAPTLNYNWNIQGYVGFAPPTAAPVISAVHHEIASIPVHNGTFGRRGANKGAAPTLSYQKQIPVVEYGLRDNNRVLTGYKVWRLIQGQEDNEASWTVLTADPINALTYLDTGWSALPDGTYKWCVKAVYTGGALSPSSFSNALPKVTQIGTIAGIVRNMQNVPISGATITCNDDTATTNAQGAYSMQVLAGTHSVTATHPNYESSTHTGVVVLTGQTTTVNFQLSPASNEVEDGFESYANFATTFAPWTCVDVDMSATYTMTGTTWPGAGSAMAFMVFNPTATTPPITTFTAHGGVKMAVAIAATTPPNNDWLITPQVNNPTAFKFWARSLTAQYGLERFKVGVSTSTAVPAAFTIISGATYLEAPIEWTEYTYDVSSYDGQVYLGIQCLSNDAWFFMVDDVQVWAVDNDDPEAPAVVTTLKNNFPNPFNPETTIAFSVKEAMPVTIEIYNVKGQKVKTLVNETKAAGNYTVPWNGTDSNGRSVSSGIYYYKMTAGKYSSTKKMIMMK
ncbi:MAG: carboxypeptidase regulatory-like domain-containing protein, partial [Candidatus Cloacimonetes bacterium]|nr:carboxypeptidase regulatory-like domain-containing protein [Candidatus Cloacimonadota bacterium]